MTKHDSDKSRSLRCSRADPRDNRQQKRFVGLTQPSRHEVQKHKDKHAALRFFKKRLKTEGRSANQLATDKLLSYGAARRNLMPGVQHCTERYCNNRAEAPHEKTRMRERQMRTFASPGQAQRFLVVHDRLQTRFDLAAFDPHSHVSNSTRTRVL